MGRYCGISLQHQRQPVVRQHWQGAQIQWNLSDRGSSGSTLHVYQRILSLTVCVTHLQDLSILPRAVVVQEQLDCKFCLQLILAMQITAGQALVYILKASRHETASILQMQAGVWYQRCYDCECGNYRSETMPLPTELVRYVKEVLCNALCAPRPSKCTTESQTQHAMSAGSALKLYVNRWLQKAATKVS